MSLKKIVGRTSLDHDELSTVLTEVECIINARPLTYVYDDNESISHPLTPSHLINGRRVTAMPNSEHFEVISTYQTLTRRQHHHRNLLQQFARQWKHEYLLNLRENAVVKSTKEGSELISVGDIVVLKEDSKSRCFWKLGKVEELVPGRDGRVRAAVVKVASNGRKPQLLRRVIQHLIPIEVPV